MIAANCENCWYYDYDEDLDDYYCIQDLDEDEDETQTIQMGGISQ